MLELENKNLLSDDFSNLTDNYRYSNATGDPDGNEDSVEDEGEAAEAGVSSEDAPKFRKLVREKKLAMKAQYGKGHFVKTTKKTCKKVLGKERCISTPEVKWVSGWRKKWKEFKNSGGLAQLKQQAKGYVNTGTPTGKETTTTETETTSTPTTTETTTTETTTTTEYQKTSGGLGSEDKKILGMKPVIAYSAIGATVVVLGIVGYLVYKAKSKN